MQPSFSSGDWNPFSSLARAAGKIGKKPDSDVEARAMEMHKAQYASHQYGMESATHKAGLEEQAQQAQHGRNMEFFGSVLRHAKHETPVHLSIGDVSVQFTKRPKQTKVAQPAPQQTAPKVVQRDPKTGRAMKAN